jgi:cytochrome c
MPESTVRSFATFTSVVVLAAVFGFGGVADTEKTAGDTTTTSVSAQRAAGTDTAEKPPQPECGNPSATVHLTGKTCGPLEPPQISCDLPIDVDGALQQPNLNVRQRAADIFSWQDFLALNWPMHASYRGQPDAHKRISDPGPRVWETWKEAYEVCLPTGDEPPPWNSPQQMPEGCGDADVSKVLSRRQKVDDVIDEKLQPTGADKTLPATLTDQKGRLVRYEIRLNEVLFDYIRAHKLYNGAIQAAANAVRFPSGSMLIKAAWRELEAQEEPLFHTISACVCETTNDGFPTDCGPKRMGLVGLHIMHKTPSAPQWVWSTFEHVNNVTSRTGAPASFNNPRCDSKDCPPNQQTPPGLPNQVTRVTPIPSADPDCDHPEQAVDNVRELNANMRQALADRGSVLQYYELINSQFPLPVVATDPGSDPTPSTVFDVRPTWLANTTLETFIQETSSCMGCHAMARTLRLDTVVSADFSFTLNNAYPEPVNAQIISRPDQPQSAWDKAHWDSIVNGYDLTRNTYTALPQFVTAKLRCESCHLNAGGNARAAWWVNMPQKYDYPASSKLQDRINWCFERSVNGRALCSTAPANETCKDDASMHSLIAYMQWLTKQWEHTHSGTSPTGFPNIPPRMGYAGRGEAIFEQKCAFCHGADGQGRYEHGVYFRPAL